MAVYTEVTDEDLDAFIATYDIGHVVSCKGIAEGVENTNYLLQTSEGRFILTLYEKRVSEKDLPFFLGLLDHLATKDFPSPTPIHDKNKDALRKLNQRPAAIVSFLDGISVHRPTPKHCQLLGEMIAQLHLDTVDFPLHRANALNTDGWEKLFGDCRKHADDFQTGLEEEIAADLDDIVSHWPTQLPKGVIHADLFPDNVFFLDNQVSGFIDFYFACDDLLAYDLAICLNAWCFEPDGQFNITKARALTNSYQKRRKLGANEINALPILCRGAAMRFFLTRLADWFSPVDGALVKPKDPNEYLRKLRFHRDLRGPDSYGVD